LEIFIKGQKHLPKLFQAREMSEKGSEIGALKRNPGRYNLAITIVIFTMARSCKLI
jgi:hypothetical protein